MEKSYRPPRPYSFAWHAVFPPYFVDGTGVESVVRLRDGPARAGPPGASGCLSRPFAGSGSHQSLLPHAQFETVAFGKSNRNPAPRRSWFLRLAVSRSGPH